jgi:outer membrane protein assembly factor BamB
VDTISGNEYATDGELWAIKDTSPQEGAPRLVSSWPQWRSDPTHSSLAEVGPSNLSLAWRFRTEGAVISSPSVYDNTVYVGSSDGYIYALDAWNGNLKWKFKTGDLIESSPAVVNGKVYTGGDDGYVYCLDAKTGAQQWKTFVNGNLPFTFGNLVLKSSPAVVEGMGGIVVYIGSLDGYLYAIDADNGNINWKTKALGPIESSPAFFNGAVYFTAEEPDTGALYKLNAATGDVMWKNEIAYRPSFTGGNQMLGSPFVTGTKVFASSNWGDYFCYNTNTGELLWRFQNPTATEFIVSSPIYINDGTYGEGRVLLIDKFDLACVDITNGWVIWSKYTGDELYVSPSVAGGKVYMATSQRHVFVLDITRNGTIIANVTLPSSTWSSPTIANNRLYIGCNDWYVYCFEEVTTNTPSPTPTAPANNSATPSMTIIAIAVTALVILPIALGFVLRRQIKKF